MKKLYTVIPMLLLTTTLWTMEKKREEYTAGIYEEGRTCDISIQVTDGDQISEEKKYESEGELSKKLNAHIHVLKQIIENLEKGEEVNDLIADQKKIEDELSEQFGIDWKAPHVNNVMLVANGQGTVALNEDIVIDNFGIKKN